MTLPTGIEKLRTYLTSVPSVLEEARTVQVVVGNEAADLDSMASAVLYAYCKASAAAPDSTVTVPLINIPREDFKLRTEAAFLFSHAGISTDWLLFQEDLDLEALHRTKTLELVLADHNKLAANHGDFSDAVVEVIDHHADEGLYPHVSKRVIEPVGSAATLVASQLLQQTALLEAGSAELLLGTILLDTVNLDPEAQRASDLDRQVVQQLLELTGADRKKLFDKLQKEKFNVSSLDSSDLLRKDYKEWKLGSCLVGFSSVLLSIKEWLDKDADLSASLDEYASSLELDVLIAMNAYTQPEFTRELVVFCKDRQLREKLLAFLEGSDLGLKAIDGAVDEATTLYAQANLGYSRKKLQPVLREFFDSL